MSKGLGKRKKMICKLGNLMNARQTVVCPHVKQAVVTHIRPHV